MIKSIYNIIGVMSGTSLDGLDLVYAQFYYIKSWSFKILKAETISYSEKWKQTLQNLVSNSLDELQIIDENYTKYLGLTIVDFIKKNEITKIDTICSHGHTALHQPANGLTYQIGNLPVLAKLLKQTIVCDFRVQDVKLGGQGAPLVPIGDHLLFSEYDYCLNLGGFANVSYNNEGKRVAYDICPVNIVLNKYAKQLGFEYDDKGMFAKSGTYLLSLGTELNNISYYKQQQPKSLGLEWVNEEIFPRLEAYKRKEIDLLRTFTEHVAQQIASSFKIRSKVLVTGGGAYNDYLLSRIQFYKKVMLIKPNKELIEFKEALIFGFLGVLKLREENNCLSSVTGASKDHSSGNIYLP